MEKFDFKKEKTNYIPLKPKWSGLFPGWYVEWVSRLNL